MTDTAYAAEVKYPALVLEKVPGGGYLVREAPAFSGVMAQILFACSTLGEAVGFITHNIQDE